MTKEEVMQKIRDIVSQDKNLVGAEVEISFRDKQSNKTIKEKIKIEEC